MKLNQRHEEQAEGDKQTKRDGKILRKKESAETKYPSEYDHDLELARGVRFQNLKRHQHNDERHARLDAFDRAVAEKNRAESNGREHGFKGNRAQPIPSGFHPKLSCECDEKQCGYPRGEAAKHRWQGEKKRRRKPQKRSSRNTCISFANCFHLNKASARKQ